MCESLSFNYFEKKNDMLVTLFWNGKVQYKNKIKVKYCKNKSSTSFRVIIFWNNNALYT